MGGPGIQCLNCQRSILLSFINASRSARRPSSWRIRTRPPGHYRAFNRNAHLRSDASQQHFQVVERARYHALDAQLEPSSKGQDAAAESPPWYLQDRLPPSEPPNYVTDRQRIPELPPNSPTMLQPLLEQISIDLGLDYLSLLDLRELDPPPALGANLIMIFGSARSEKHLHVSADRLCRWLRSNYKLTPYADGLLGRNELKLKMRRKTRRSKLLGMTGASKSQDPDDGIRTGWVCVNVGIIPGGKGVETFEDNASRPGFVGFGNVTRGIKIVVQMMTEEKREEVDLEMLWTDMLKREARKETKPVEENSKTAEADEPESYLEKPQASSTSSGSRNTQHHFWTSTAARSSFAREYHTSSRCHIEARIADEDPYEGLDSSDLEPRLQKQSLDANMGPQKKNSGQRPRGIRHGAAAKQDLDAFGSTLGLRTQMNYLQGLSSTAALEELGEGDADTSTTAFLESFHQSVPMFPNQEHFECLMDFQSTALKLCHPGYRKENLMQKLRDMQLAGWQPSQQTYQSSLEAVLLAPHTMPKARQKTKRDKGDRIILGTNALEESLDLAFQLLEEMENYGYSTMDDNVFVLLYRAVANPKFWASPNPSISESEQLTISDVGWHARGNAPFGIWRYYIGSQLHKIRTAMAYLNWQPESDSFFTEVLQIHADQGSWRDFWTTWNSIPRMKRPRGPALYRLLFSEMARTGNQRECLKVLTTQVENMELEQPKVELTEDLAGPVIQCLRVANASAERGPWVQLWNRCQRALEGRQDVGDHVAAV